MKKPAKRGPGRPPSWTPAVMKQAEEVLGEHRTVKAAAAAMGVTEDALHGAFKRRGTPAAGFLIAPDHQVIIPERHRIKGNSTLTDEHGIPVARWVKTERDSDTPPAFLPVPEGHIVKKVSSFLDSQGQVRGQWVQAPQEEQARWDKFWAACEKATKAYKGIAGRAVAPKKDAVNDRTMTLYPLGDPHIGMYSWGRETGKDFDLRIAERDLLGTIDMLVDRAPASKRAVLCNVGDFFHAENDTQLTPTGKNKLDCDNRWAKITEVGFAVMRRMIDRLLVKHQAVDVINVPGNHDPQMARMLSLWCRAVYEKEPRVNVVDNANPIMYIRFGEVLLGFAHGDDPKPQDLGAVMAADRPEDWGVTKHRMWVTGHVHHLTRKEYPGCIVETFRTLAPADAWHHRKGYRSGQSLCAITIDERWGETTRSTVDLRFTRSENGAPAPAQVKARL